MEFLVFLVLTAVAVNAEVCVNNGSKSLTYYGDSRMDTGSTSNFLDVQFFKKGAYQATWGNGMVVQMFHRYPGFEYVTKSQSRFVYMGINDCGNINDNIDLPGTVTKEAAMIKMYAAITTGEIHHGTTMFSHPDYSRGWGNWGAGRGMAFTTNSAGTLEVGPGGQSPRSGNTVYYAVCVLGTGTLGSVTLSGRARSCGIFSSNIQITNFKGLFWVSPKTFILTKGNADYLLFKSYGRTAVCTELENTWATLVTEDTPNVGGLYPGGGPDTMHGSPSVVEFFNKMVTGNCSKVDWELTGKDFCRTENDCVMRPEPTKAVTTMKMTTTPTTTTKQTTKNMTTTPSDEKMVVKLSQEEYSKLVELLHKNESVPTLGATGGPSPTPISAAGLFEIIGATAFAIGCAIIFVSLLISAIRCYKGRKNGSSVSEIVLGPV